MDEGTRRAPHKDETSHARPILTPPPATPAGAVEQPSILAKLALKGLTPVALLTVVLVVESIFAVAKLTQVVAEVQTAESSPTSAAPAVVVAVSASPQSASPSPSASATLGPVRTLTRTAEPAPVCGDARTHRITGRVTLADGSPMYNAAVDLYKAPDGAYMSTFHTDQSGRYVALVIGGTYKIHFIPSVVATAEWWNDQSSQATANVVFACTGDVNGVDAVLTR